MKKTKQSHWVATLIIIILSIACTVFFIKYKEAQADKAAGQAVTVYKGIPKIKVVEKAKYDLTHREAQIETFYVDTHSFDIGAVTYNNPWSILELHKNGLQLRYTMVKPTGAGENDYISGVNVFGLTYGNDFDILPTRDPKKPFRVIEHRDFFKVSGELGWGASEKIYIETGIWYKGIKVKNMVGSVGLKSHVSFKLQDLDLVLFKVEF